MAANFGEHCHIHSVPKFYKRPKIKKRNLKKPIFLVKKRPKKTFSSKKKDLKIKKRPKKRPYVVLTMQAPP